MLSLSGGEKNSEVVVLKDKRKKSTVMMKHQ